VKVDAFADSLVRKSERAVRIARLSLQNGDPDSAVNRAYYAMFNTARAALLKSGVPEGELPRTHRGINEAFRQYAVLPGRIDSDLASALSRAENLRLMADYTASEIETEAASRVVEEKFVRTVEHEFGLQIGESRHPDTATTLRSPEEERRQARENWLRLRQQQTANEIAPSKEPSRGQAHGPQAPAAGPGEGHGLENDTE
jgi:uncharacterized protein (UPF0332 family)